VQVTLYVWVFFYQANFILTPAYIWLYGTATLTVGGIVKKFGQMQTTRKRIKYAAQKCSPVVR